jgi:hypothetical protein
MILNFFSSCMLRIPAIWRANPSVELMAAQTVYKKLYKRSLRHWTSKCLEHNTFSNESQLPFRDTKLFFLPVPPHFHIDFVVPPPGCGRSVTDIWGLGAHMAQLRCPNEMSDDAYIWEWSTRWGRKPKFYKLPRPWSLWGYCPARENSYGRTGNQTRDLMVRRSEQATRLVRYTIIDRRTPNRSANRYCLHNLRKEFDS